MTPSLARLMNIVWLHEQNHFDDKQLCDVLRDGLSKDVLEQWNAYTASKGHQDNNLEVSFFGKEQKAIGNYSARLARYETRQWEEHVFWILILFERFPERYKERSRRERLINIIHQKNTNMKGRLPKDLLSEVEFLERKYRTYKKKYYTPQKFWTDFDGNVVNRKGEIIIPRKEEAKAEK
jgi:hypothetical protein